MALPVIPADKANHLVYGAAIALLAMHAAAGFAQARSVQLPVPAPLIGWLAAALFGVAKEVHDRLRNLAAARAGQAARHGVEWGDVLATGLGGLVIMLAAV